jgi:sugar lactone lactonase YvrE
VRLEIVALGEVYTSESGVGRIKRFDPDGSLLDVVGKADIVPGCKNVAIGVSEDSQTVYMLDITRSRLIMFKAAVEKKSLEEESAEAVGDDTAALQ